MKPTIFKSLPILLFVFALSCQTGIKQTKNDHALVINLTQQGYLKKISLSQFLVHDEYIALETTPNCLIGDIRKIEIYNDLIFILDPYSAKKLLVFNKPGKFLYSVSQRGKGPGEYLDIFDFLVHEDKIFILNNRSSVIEYSLDGQFIRTYSLPFWADKLIRIDKNNWGLLPNSGKSNGYEFNFYTTSLDFKNEKGSLRHRFEDYPIDPTQQVSSPGDTSYFFLPLDNKIYRAGNKGAIAKYVLQYPDNYILSDSELSSYEKLPMPDRLMKVLDNSISLSTIVFTDNLKMIRYKQQGKPFMCFLNSEMEYLTVSEEEITNDIDSVSLLPAFHTSAGTNKIVSSFQRHKLMDALKVDKKMGAELGKILSGTEENSNPIIAIYSVQR
jgi:hypothetical protein